MQSSASVHYRNGADAVSPSDWVSDAAVSLGREFEDEKSDAIRLVQWKRLSGEPPPRRWFINDWLPPAPTLLAGAGGLGKSLFVQSLCTALSIGREFLGAIPTPRRCLILSCEDDTNEAWRRQAAINRHFGIGMDDLAGLFISPRVGEENVLFVETIHELQTTNVFDRLRQKVNDLAIDVLAIDNIAHTYGANAVDAHRVTLFINQLQGLVKGRDFAPILIGHPSRREDSEFSGSAAWENAVRMRWHLRDKPPDGHSSTPSVVDGELLYIARRKSNYTELGFETLVRKDGLIVPNAQANDPAAVEEMLAAHKRIVLEGLQRLTEMGFQVSDAESSTNNLPRKLLHHGLARGASAAQLTKAMLGLLQSGHIIRLQIRVNGKDRRILQLAQPSLPLPL